MVGNTSNGRLSPRPQDAHHREDQHTENCIAHQQRTAQSERPFVLPSSVACVRHADAVKLVSSTDTHTQGKPTAPKAASRVTVSSCVSSSCESCSSLRFIAHDTIPKSRTRFVLDSKSHPVSNLANLCSQSPILSISKDGIEKSDSNCDPVPVPEPILDPSPISPPYPPNPFNRCIWLGAAIFLIVALVAAQTARTNLCLVVGPNGALCGLTQRACMLPAWACTDVANSFRAMRGREALGTALAVSSRSRAVTDFVAATMSALRHGDMHYSEGYANTYGKLEKLRRQGRKVREASEEVLEHMPVNAIAIMSRLKSMHVRAMVAGKYIDSDSNRVISFLENLDDDMNTIIEHVDKEARSWQILHDHIRLLKDYGSDVADTLSELVGNGNMGALLRRSDVLSPVHVSATDRVRGGVLSGTVGATVAVATLFTLPVAAPFAGAVATLGVLGFSYKRSSDMDAKYYKIQVAQRHVEDSFEIMHHSLPRYLEKVQLELLRTKTVKMQLVAVRDAVGDAETERLRILANRRATRSALRQFSASLETAIEDMSGLRRLCISASEQWTDYSTAAIS